MYTGQVHAHSTRSDGRQSPADVVKFYRRAGYDFTILSDHLTITPDPNVSGILFLTGIEDNASKSTGQSIYQHINRIGAKFLTPRPHTQADIFTTSKREGSFSVINHPNWPGRETAYPGWTDKQLLAAKGYDAIEVWNASVRTNDGRRADVLLKNRRRVNLVASDDCHDINSPTCGTTRLFVNADLLTADSIIAALRSGNYYSSSGARLSISVAQTALTISVSEKSRVDFIGGKNGMILRSGIYDSDVTYKFRGDEIYVRAQVTVTRDGTQAWTNPVYVLPKK